MRRSVTSLPILFALLAPPAFADLSADCEPGGLPAGGRFSAGGAVDLGSRHRDDSCFATPDQVRGWAAEGPVELVDLREPSAFAAVHVDGSLNLEPRALARKQFLTGKRIVLLHSAPASELLERTCHELKEAGFERVTALDGGIAIWPEEVTPLVGERGAEQRSRRIEPHELFAESFYDHWIFVNASSRNLDADAVLPIGSVHSPPGIGGDGLRIEVERAYDARRASGRSVFVAVLDDDGTRYAELERALAPLELENVFYGEGGINAYLEYRSHRELMVARASKPWDLGCRNRVR